MSRSPERAAPPVSWRAVLLGAVLAVVIALLGALAAAPLPAALVAVAAGGALAGRIAGAAGLLQGAVVAVLFIVAQGLIGPIGPGGRADLVADTVATVGQDALLLALGAAGGWLATRS
jgi:hypothetical protein